MKKLDLSCALLLCLTLPAMLHCDGGSGVRPQRVRSYSTVTVTPPTRRFECKDYRVVRCDSLWKIAAKVYGDGYLWALIYEENKSAFGGWELIRKARLRLGQVISICVLNKNSGTEKQAARERSRRYKGYGIRTVGRSRARRHRRRSVCPRYK